MSTWIFQVVHSFSPWTKVSPLGFCILGCGRAGHRSHQEGDRRKGSNLKRSHTLHFLKSILVGVPVSQGLRSPQIPQIGGTRRSLWPWTSLNCSPARREIFSVNAGGCLHLSSQFHPVSKIWSKIFVSFVCFPTSQTFLRIWEELPDGKYKPHTSLQENPIKPGQREAMSLFRSLSQFLSLLCLGEFLLISNPPAFFERSKYKDFVFWELALYWE